MLGVDAGRCGRDAASLRRLQLAPGLVPAGADRRATTRPARAPRCAGSSRPARSSPPSRTTRCAPAAPSTSRRGSSGAVVAYIVVARHPALVVGRCSGCIVLLGVPVLVLLARRRDQAAAARQRDQREEVGKLTALGADTAAGLRVLRGIGGEQAFFDRYRRRSQQRARRRRPRRDAAVDARRRPGASARGSSSCVVTWIGARFAALRRRSRRRSWSRSTATPPSSSSRCAPRPRRSTRSRARSSAPAGCCSVLAVERDIVGARVARRRAAAPASPSSTRAPGSSSRPGRLTCLVSGAARRDEPRSPTGSAASATSDGVAARRRASSTDLPLDVVRRRIVVSEADPVLFSGHAPQRARPVGPRDGDDARS